MDNDRVDEIRIYNRSLSEEEVAILVNGGSSLTIADYSMAKGKDWSEGESIGVLYDSSGLAHHLKDLGSEGYKSLGAIVPGIEGVDACLAGTHDNTLGLEVLDDDSFTIFGGLTVAAWVYFDEQTLGMVAMKDREYSLEITSSEVQATVIHEVNECCEVDCEGKECGPDGCGYFCGFCGGNQICEYGACWNQ